ncbi:unnamed protein product [Phytophthora fragariaefolia]|uniref:Unnamed protein product n=1 Tax=Phytophthora fragariaefolia TaxID=1490495 RepID=A0A9W6X520_9STRA|nr:unnamed protein product [Phytophthora fragariaefolia]
MATANSTSSSGSGSETVTQLLAEVQAAVADDPALANMFDIASASKMSEEELTTLLQELLDVSLSGSGSLTAASAESTQSASAAGSTVSHATAASLSTFLAVLATAAALAAALPSYRSIADVMTVLRNVLVGGRVQPLDYTLGPDQLRHATDVQTSSRFNHSSHEKNSFRKLSRPLSSSISSLTLAVQRVRPAPRVLVFAVGTACLFWTLLLLQLTVAPNYTVNWVMKTQRFDGGSFWLLVDLPPTILALGILGLWLVGIGFLSVLMRIVKLGQPIRTKEIVERSAGVFLASSWEYSWLLCCALVLIFVNGRLCTIADSVLAVQKVCIKLGDFFTDFALLYLNLEAGSPVVLLVVLTTITVSSALSSAVLVSLPSEKTSLLVETLLDTLFDFLVAIAYPCLALVYCFSTFSFDYKLLDINLDIYPAGWFETVASVIADPVQTAIIHRILKSLRIVSVLDFFARVGVNVFLCTRLHYVVCLLHDPCWQSKRPFEIDAKHRFIAGSVFACLAAITMVFVEESIRTSTLACKPHTRECATNAWRWIEFNPASLVQCPCLTLIDRDQAPTSYAEWITPKDLTEKVAQLATTEDLQAIQLTNRFLPVLPSELQRCKNLKYV